MHRYTHACTSLHTCNYTRKHNPTHPHTLTYTHTHRQTPTHTYQHSSLSHTYQQTPTHHPPSTHTLQSSVHKRHHCNIPTRLCNQSPYTDANIPTPHRNRFSQHTKITSISLSFLRLDLHHVTHQASEEEAEEADREGGHRLREARGQDGEAPEPEEVRLRPEHSRRRRERAVRQLG